jgi:hypothetical protein
MVLLACGGGEKTGASTTPAADLPPPPPPPETEADRVNKRHAAAIALIPEGSSCLPPELKNLNAPRLELAAIESDAVLCAIDQERIRLLGPVACWNVELSGPEAGKLTYRDAAQDALPLPGRGIAVMFDDRCARGYCVPREAAIPTDQVALMARNLEGTKVAVLSGDDLHIFDASSKAYELSFSIRGDKGVASSPTAIHWNGDAIFVEASDGTTSPVWMFKPDGTAVGPIEALGGKDKTPLSTRNGSFVLLDKTRVGISEHGFSTLTTYEIDSGKRAKLVRKVPAPACKKAELEGLWRDPGATASSKCKDFMAKNYLHLVGADVVAGTKNFLVLLRGPRLGELAVIDAKTLAEHKAIKMPWCDAGGSDAGGAEPAGGAGPSADAEPERDDKTDRAEKADKAREKAARKPSAAPKAKGDAVEDPDSGGE